jgi:Bacterial regulatory helix-turn-helix protein, lysR family
MNLRQLQYFVEIGELESVTRAAERLHVAQPALSRHMRPSSATSACACSRATAAASR